MQTFHYVLYAILPHHGDVRYYVTENGTMLNRDRRAARRFLSRPDELAWVWSKEIEKVEQHAEVK